MARKPKKKKPPALKPLSRGQKLTLWGVLLLALPLAYPSLVVLGLSLLPSFVGWKLDRKRDRYLGGSIAVLNFTAALPGVFDVMQRGHDAQALAAVLAQPLTWLLPYGAAALAGLIYIAMPSFVIPYYFGHSGRRLVKLEERRQELLTAWGEEIDPGEITVSIDDGEHEEDAPAEEGEQAAA